MKEISGGVCAPRGFFAGGIRCGIKASASKRDLAIVYSKKPCASAALFTANCVRAASVIVSEETAKNRAISAVIINSGNANACTGEAGLDAARRMALAAAQVSGADVRSCAVASTGVIGVPLPVEKIEESVRELAAAADESEEGAQAALEAIMTTDTRKKSAAVEISCADGRCVRIGAMVKGSGMIHPNMGTMICVITSDAALKADELESALRRAVNRSFNRLSVDGDTSTNDMVLLMANGESGAVDSGIFAQALEDLCVKLTRMMAADGEGATKLLSAAVSGAQSEEEAAVLAKSVVSSNLVKAACFGADANWGRVLCALGYSGVRFDPAQAEVYFASDAGQILVCKNGGGVDFSEEKAKEILKRDEITIQIRVGGGSGSACAWGCDLSYDYVKINGDYRS